MNPKRFSKLASALRRRQPDLTVLMEQVHKSHNLSAILRNCDAVGVLEAHAVPPAGGLDIHGHASAGTSKWVKVVRHATTRDAVEALKAKGFCVLAAHPGPNATDFRAVDYTEPTAIMVGAELLGLSKEGISWADEQVVIPMMGMVRSFNVSVAAAILLVEAFCQRQRAGMYDVSRLDPEDFERILFEWAYPRVARLYREQRTPYPSLSADGGFVQVSSTPPGASEARPSGSGSIET